MSEQGMRELPPNWQVGLGLFIFVATLGLTISWLTTLRDIYEIARDPGLATATVVDVHHEYYQSFVYIYSVGSTNCTGRGYLDQRQSVTVGQTVSIQYARHSPCFSTDHPRDDPWAYFRDSTRDNVAAVAVFAAAVALLFGRIPRE